MQELNEITMRLGQMKSIISISLSAALLAGFAPPAFAYDYTNAPAFQPTEQEQLVATLQDASDQARVAAQESKNHQPFAGKTEEIDSLIQRIQNGQPVSSAEINDALTPATIY
jgi:hypothetical protein